MDHKHGQITSHRRQQAEVIIHIDYGVVVLFSIGNNLVGILVPLLHGKFPTQKKRWVSVVKDIWGQLETPVLCRKKGDFNAFYYKSFIDQETEPITRPVFIRNSTKTAVQDKWKVFKWSGKYSFLQNISLKSSSYWKFSSLSWFIHWLTINLALFITTTLSFQNPVSCKYRHWPKT